jgi:hypothetical protein
MSCSGLCPVAGCASAVWNLAVLLPVSYIIINLVNKFQVGYTEFLTQEFPLVLRPLYFIGSFLICLNTLFQLCRSCNFD